MYQIEWTKTIEDFDFIDIKNEKKPKLSLKEKGKSVKHHGSTHDNLYLSYATDRANKAIVPHYWMIFRATGIVYNPNRLPN